MPPLTAKQEEALHHFLERIRADFAAAVREVRVLTARPDPTDDAQPDLGLLIRLSLVAEASHEVDHALDNLACEVALVDEVLLQLHLSHDGEPRDETVWAEPVSHGLYP